MIIALFCYVALAAFCFYFMSRAFTAEAKLRLAMRTIWQLDSSELQTQDELTELQDHLAHVNQRLAETTSERDAYFQVARELYESWADQSGGDATMVARIRRRGQAMQDARVLLGRPTPVRSTNGSSN